MPKKNELPPFLSGIVTPEDYEKWLRRKAQTHMRRDHRRGNSATFGESYRDAIHAAVIASGGRDAYTGEELNWTLILRYDNDKSREGGRRYKHDFALLPTVDHVGDGTGAADFKICGWRTNDAKHDLELPEFMTLCRAVLEHNGYVVEQRG